MAVLSANEADDPACCATAGWRAWALAVAVSLAALGVSLWLIGGQIGRPFVYDDISFMQGARAIADTGRPYGNQGYMLHLYDQRDQWALWHPPLYLYLLGATVRLFGDSEPAARGIGALCLLIAAAFAFDLARRVVLSRGGGPQRALAAGALAVALYALNPLAIQASMVLDIDNTILMVLMLALVWLAIRLPVPWGLGTVVGLALLFGLSLWAKMTTPLAVAAALVFTRFFQPVGWRGALQAALMVLLGTVVFTLTWVGISAAANLPIGYTLDVVRNEAIESSASSRDRLV